MNILITTITLVFLLGLFILGILCEIYYQTAVTEEQKNVLKKLNDRKER